MAEKVGTLIRKARTDAGLTQEQLARKIKGLSADDISKAERGEKDLTQAMLREIAKATGVTQKSLIDAVKGSSSAAKPANSAGSSASFHVSNEEKKLIRAYREADGKIQTAVKMMLLGSGNTSLSSSGNGLAGDLFGGLLSGLQELFKN
jgi:transcriptional regulator with XRE-family HTH domain